jgi:hypothetical protein
MAAALELPLGDYLRDDEGHQHREAETAQLQWADAIDEWVVNDRH